MRPAGADLTVPEGALLPCVVQDADSGAVLMLAYVDAEALEATRRTGLAHFHSRSRERLSRRARRPGTCCAWSRCGSTATRMRSG